jgi:hypothetical protein
MDRIKDYSHKSKILRQIMSNQARFYGKVNAMQNVITVIVSSLLGFIGFSGTEKVQQYLGLFMTANAAKVDFIYNFLIFCIFVLATLHLVFHFGKKQTDAENAIVTLTNVVNHADDLISKDEHGGVITASDRDALRYRYDTTIQHIPANSDGEFLKAKLELQKKEVKSARITLSPQTLFDEPSRLAALKSLVSRSTQVMEILNILRKVDPDLYLGGGLIRNLVWDYLHGFKNPTPVDDVDVIYFNNLNQLKQHDTLIEAKLLEHIPNLSWSVKNQARMHIFNSEPPYTGIEDAINKWPETATAIIIRLNSSGDLEIIAPHGLSDLFRLIVRPTPHFVTRTARIQHRITSKRWRETWSKLDII